MEPFHLLTLLGGAEPRLETGRFAVFGVAARPVGRGDGGQKLALIATRPIPVTNHSHSKAE